MSDEPTGSVTVKPRDKNVPHPYDSTKAIKFPSETFPAGLCGQLRRLIRREQVTLDEPEKAVKKEESTKAKKPKRKGGKGHQAKPTTTES